jgi:tetratricopeptide (TPR) repeat protein
MAFGPITLKGMWARDHAPALPRPGVRVAAAFILAQLLLLGALMLVFPSAAGAAPVKGEVSVSTANGYARIIFTLAEDVEADVRLAGGILIVQFKQPVDVPVERVPTLAVGYVAAARSDPDGTGVRMALKRKVTVNTMAAGEKLFVDLLPEGWVGLAPGLPQEVVEELARRARDAEKTARLQLQAKQQKALPPLRVRVGAQPTFARFTFPLPGLVAVSNERVEDKMTLTFEAPLRFDLADVQASLPPTVSAVEAKAGKDNIAVSFDFIGKVDIRTFREDNDYFVDVLPLAREPEAKKPAAAAREQAPPPVSAPASVPARVPVEPPSAAEQGAARPAETARLPETIRAKPPEAVKPTEAAAPRPAAPIVVKPPAEPLASAPVRDIEAGMPELPADSAAPVAVDVRRQGEAMRLTFPFNQPTPAAVFRRSDTLWLVFDSQTPIDIGKLSALAGQTIRSSSVTRSRGGQVVTLKLDRPKLTSMGADGATWTVTIGDVMLDQTQPLSIARVTQAAGRASATIAFADPRRVHRLTDPDIGDTLFVVTALGPARGFVKTQEFVEFNALVSTHGVVIQPLADDVAVDTTADKITVARPGGLALSTAAAARPMAGAGASFAGAGGGRAGGVRSQTLDPQTWGFDRESNFRDRQMNLVAAAAAATDPQRLGARLDLARFYLARNMSAEAKGVLDATAAENRTATPDANVLMLRAVANIMLRRGSEALKDLSGTSINAREDAVLWRALAQVQQGKWPEAREGLAALSGAAAALPLELQRYAFQEAVRAAVEVRDFGTAASLLNEFDTFGPSPQSDADLTLLKGRTMEGLGRMAEALTLYRAAAQSPDLPAAARARLREIALRQAVGELTRADATLALEKLTTQWRGDETEAEALQVLGRLYAEDGRFRDAFTVMHTAIEVYPQSEMTRRIQDEAAVAFESLFLGNKGDGMSAVDALSLFYDFRELTPVGRRGDEMIRKLADRLVSIDLLDQAAELLQHQVDHRLQGAARAQVSVRLAVIYLIARKPDRALSVLRTSRTGDLPNEMRNQRLLLEARALSDTGRPDVALEVVAGMQGREVERLRADILWKGRRWRETGEQIEKFYGERWRDFAPLVESERADVMRAAIGYALGEDAIGLERFRNKYAPKMADGPDRRGFEVVTAPMNTNAPEFADIARVVASTDTLDQFLRDIRQRYPDTAPAAATPAAATPAAAPDAAPPAQPERGANAATRNAG